MTMGQDADASASSSAEPSGAPTREFRARWTFTIAAAFGASLLILYNGLLGAFPISAVLGAILNVIAAAIEASGLAGRRDWARYAMTPLLWLFIVTGLLQLLLALTNNGFNIPIGAILAAWALLAKPSTALGPVPTRSTEGQFLVAGAVASAVLSIL
jgi:hypothetical protein